MFCQLSLYLLSRKECDQQLYKLQNSWPQEQTNDSHNWNIPLILRARTNLDTKRQVRTNPPNWPSSTLLPTLRKMYINVYQEASVPTKLVENML